MVMVNRSGKMAVSMMDSGEMIKQMAMESLFMLMAIFMKGHSVMIRPMDTELISMQMEQHM